MTRRLKILSLVHDLFYGGDETRLLNFANFVDRDRFEHVVVSIHNADQRYSQRHGSMRDQFAADGIEVINLGKHHQTFNGLSLRPSNFLRGLQSLRQVVKQVQDIVKRRGIDVIDARLHAAMLIGAVTAKQCQIPSVGTHYSFTSSDKTLLRRVINQLSFAMSHTVVTDSEYWRAAIKRAIYWPGTRVVNIPNGIFAPVAERQTDGVMHEFGIPADPKTKVIAQISRLVRYKGHTDLLHAAQEVLRHYPHAFFLIVGHSSDTAYQDELHSLADRLGISDRVRIRGYQGAIGDVWQTVDIHAHASHLDSLPNAIIEGMSLGKPAVVTDVGGIPDLVTHEETGLVVPARDRSSMTKGILRLLEQPQNAEKYGRAAQERYRKMYTPPVMARKIEDLFLAVCGQQR